MFAIIREGNKQYRIAPGDTIRLDHFDAEPGTPYETDQVLAVCGDNEMKIGHPLVEGARAQGTVLEHGKDPKLIIFKNILQRLIILILILTDDHSFSCCKTIRF